MAESCNNCGASFQGSPIPEDQQPLYGGKTHFSLRMGVEYPYNHPQHYDGISEWRCPFCEERVGRWSGSILDEGECEPVFGGAI